jgi:hypothetical protein
MTATEVARRKEEEALEREIASTAAYLTKLRKAKRSLWRSRMTEKQERVREVYIVNRVSVAVIAERFGTSPGAINRWAVKFGWPRRSEPKVDAQRRRFSSVHTSTPKEAAD